MLGHRTSRTSLRETPSHRETRGDARNGVRWDVTYGTVAKPNPTPQLGAGSGLHRMATVGGLASLL